jgi:predicted amidohydrolase YtcJ
MDAAHNVRRAVAIRGEWIKAVSDEPDGLDGLRAAHTRVVDGRALTVVPAIFDTHEHLLESARNLALVQAGEARTLADLIGLIRARAAQAAPGEWVVTSMSWNETNLAERRLPTAAELDRATDTHLVLCPRGGHICAANSLALRIARIGPDTPDPSAGTIARDGAAIPRESSRAARRRRSGNSCRRRRLPTRSPSWEMRARHTGRSASARFARRC